MDQGSGKAAAMAPWTVDDCERGRFESVRSHKTRAHQCLPIDPDAYFKTSGQPAHGLPGLPACGLPPNFYVVVGAMPRAKCLMALFCNCVRMPTLWQLFRAIE